MTDDAAFALLYVPDVWIYDLSMPLVGTLREALTKAFELSNSGRKSPDRVRTPTGDKVIEHEQMYRLWERLALVG